MDIDHETYYRALTSRDGRFDGLFFVGVTTTGIYCRPVCSARTPRQERCRFFGSAALAEKEGFRPCLRCRPELAPGHAAVDAVRTAARVAAARIEAGALNNGNGLEDLAASLGLSGRQLRRVVRAELGVSPIELAQTRRLLLAKQLLTETALPVIQVAFAAGFESVRRFNTLFRQHYGLTPGSLRRSGKQAATDSIRLTLAYRAPYAWRAILRFLATHTTGGVELVQGSSYLRTAALGSHRGWLRVEPLPGRDALVIDLATSLTPVLPVLLGRLRALFDLDARPDVIAACLGSDPRLAEVVQRVPGIRLPGSFDGFEGAMRAILGQRVSVAAATTVAGRVARTFGTPLETPFPGLNQLAPTAERMAGVKVSTIAALGIPLPRATAVVALAQAVSGGEIDLTPGSSPEATIEALMALPGVGPWTAHYIAMRVLGWPDAFPGGDLVLGKSAGATSQRELGQMAETWRPWRAYAAMYLWQRVTPPEQEQVHDHPA